MLNIERILVPIDFSEHTAQVLAHARAFAEIHGTALELVDVIEEPTFPAFYSAVYAAAYGEAPASLEEEARAAFERLTRAVWAITCAEGKPPPRSSTSLKSMTLTSLSWAPMG